MSNNKKGDYILNFPITLLVGFMTDSAQKMSNIISYCVYELFTKTQDKEYTQKIIRLSAESWKLATTEGEELHRITPRNVPFGGLSVPTVWEYMNQPKTDFDKVVLLAFVAFKSILGSKAYYKTTQAEVFKRMAGKTGGNVPKEIKKYCTRTRFDHIKRELEESWGVIFYTSHTRGVYFSMGDKMTLEDLALIAEQRKWKTRQQVSTLKMQQAKEKALSKIKEKYTNAAPK